MSLESAILDTTPTSYWPLNDVSGPTCHDDMALNDATIGSAGVKLAVIPFGASRAPYFDGEIGSSLTVDKDPRYSQPHANALTVAAWICPLACDHPNTDGSADRYVHFIEKSFAPSNDVEWAMRLYNHTNPKRHARLSFYTFNLGSPTGEGNGAYMEFHDSANDETPVDLGKWLFVVGEAEPWHRPHDGTVPTGCMFWKQNIKAVRSIGDKYAEFCVHPEAGKGPLHIGGTASFGYKGAIAHIAIWNRLLTANEIAAIWNEGLADLRATPMYHSYP